MVSLIRNFIMILTTFSIAAVNIYFDLLNPYVACLIAVMIGYFFGRIVELFFINQAHSKMRRSYGKDWS